MKKEFLGGKYSKRPPWKHLQQLPFEDVGCNEEPMDDPVCGGAGAETTDLSTSHAVCLKVLPREAQLLQAGDVMG